MKKITQNQIDVIMEVLVKANIDIQTYLFIQKTFDNLQIINIPQNMAQQIPPVSTKTAKFALEDIKG
jgi:hypothetical protein